ncbi:YbaB/EbfC family nucleoid-associated protein [Paractinoplanes atraurantiacus]|uniref:YbaB/EbfC DNA-binding family protein n=1 Tax=Paractinoplanes atraurantiacus TaxID=1036182 RepID=A0A285H0K7_9ACTN|nr:YbaB/EbfC family nucleoid-associated protein [Actinoplanes atraurantiacus]SNY29302.1 YbaB/EbfC DNA-binding family protein [Actinoplanes atraurantiacus]
MPSGNIAERLATLSATATDDDGVVTVTVAGPGVVTGLRLDDRVRQLSGAALSSEILRTMRRAQAALAERVTATVDETVGADTEDGKALLDSFTQNFPEEIEEPPAPVMPAAPPFPTFQSTPSLPHQAPGNGYESGRDSRAR